MKIAFTAELEDMYIDNVELFGNPRWEDSSYDDAYGTVKIPVFPILDEDVTWNKDLYTTNENLLIKGWIDRNTHYIEDRFCKQLEEDSQPDY